MSFHLRYADLWSELKTYLYTCSFICITVRNYPMWITSQYKVCLKNKQPGNQRFLPSGVSKWTKVPKSKQEPAWHFKTFNMYTATKISKINPLKMVCKQDLQRGFGQIMSTSTSESQTCHFTELPKLSKWLHEKLMTRFCWKKIIYLWVKVSEQLPLVEGYSH